MINIIINSMKNGNFFTIIKKIFKRFEKNTAKEAYLWAKNSTNITTEEFCRKLDDSLCDYVMIDVKKIQSDGQKKLDELDFQLGGAGNYILLYFLIRKFKPLNVVETGVAAGWSSLAILRALDKNGNGNLYSSDFPYFRLKNPEQYVGYLAKDENKNHNWHLDIRGDDVSLPEIANMISEDGIGIFHYDSDKSYSGRENALKVLSKKFNKDTIIIFDDIQDNLHFKDLVEREKKDFTVLEFEEKFIGVIGV